MRRGDFSSQQSEKPTAKKISTVLPEKGKKYKETRFMAQITAQNGVNASDSPREMRTLIHP